MLHPSFYAQLPFVTQLFNQHKIKSAYAFGSITNDSFNADSDIDLLIDFEDGLEPLEQGQIWWNLHDKLRNIFDREIDLLIEGSFKNPYFIEELNEKKQLIYAA